MVIEVKKEADANVALNKLYRYTQMQTTFAIQNIALVNNRPETLNIKQLMQMFIEHRKVVIRRRTNFLLKRCRTRAHILEGLILAVSDIDEIINIIKRSPDAPAARLNLMAKPLKLIESKTLEKLLPESFLKERGKQDNFLSGPQADAILTMQLQRLTGLEMEKLAKEYAELCEKIADYEAILADDKCVLDIIREDLFEMKEKYGDKRRTLITHDVDEFNIEDLIAEEEVLVTISHAGYIKRLPIDTYRKQGRGGKGIIASDIREGDFIEHLFVASTHDYLLVFTNRGKCYWLKVYDVPQLSRQSKGRSIANLLQLGDEKIKSIINIRDFDQRQLVMATAKGTIKKTELSAYGNVRTNGLIAIKLDPNDDLIGAAVTSGKDQVILGTHDGMAIRFEEEQVRSMGRVAHGVHGIKLRSGDAVVDMVIPKEGESLLTVCENGYGKRTDLDDYRSQSRGGIGLINIKTSDRNGKVVALKSVRDDNELMLITANGIIIRTGLGELRDIGRNTQGVRLIKLNEGDKLVAAEIIEKQEEGPEEASPAPEGGVDAAPEQEQ
jgi:DNA gyrase subunit A